MKQSSFLFPETFVTFHHVIAEVALQTINGSCKCNEHRPSPIQQSKQEIKSLMHLWPLSHLLSHVV